jgi:hypothetical protein
VVLHSSSKFIEIANFKIDEEAQEERKKAEGFMKKLVGDLDLSFSSRHHHRRRVFAISESARCCCCLLLHPCSPIF